MDATLSTTQNGQRLVKNPCLEPCPIEKAMRVIGGKWTASILWHLKDGPVRFNDLSRLIAGASKKMISERLKHLEQHKLITRKVNDSSPISVSYELTAIGKDALSLLRDLQVWHAKLDG